MAAALGVAAHAQAPNTVAEPRALEGHVPAWAKDANFDAPMPAEQTMGQMTLVLARHPDREQAFEQLLTDQQDPSSPQYHHWLTPSQIGERFGLSDAELDNVRYWLAPGRNFIGFTGSAGDVSRAFASDVNYYSVKGERKFSIASAPRLPGAVSSLVKSVRGLSTTDERPQHQMRPVSSASPLVTNGSDHYVAPADFSVIYDVPSTYTGKGVKIGLVGRARVDTADLVNFRQKTATTFANPTVIVPTAFGGVDPGPALTAPPSNPSLAGDQGEATLDVLRSGSTAQGASILLVVSTAYPAGDIGADAEYLIQTEPVPVQVMSISFGACEGADGASGVQFWDSLFQQAAGEGISVFVSSGDSGASGCDANFQPPPAAPKPNSPNYICSSSYATCVGGTEFNDANIDDYWSGTNGTGFGSALSYIPEGAWNEPLSNDQPIVAASGGGVSAFISTPTWQTGKGVPAARAGRYTPDIAFSASGHDGYFACMAAAGGDCVGSQFGFIIFSGTSASAPGMAGIAALLDQKLKGGQGNLNPKLYPMVTTAPTAFHDVTLASSGVTSCKVATPSMCNNSIAGTAGITGGQAGYLIGAGYDEVTGLGSLDVANFLDAFSNTQPTVTTGKASPVTAKTATLNGALNPNGASIQYWFLYGKSSTLAGAAKTAVKTASGSNTVAVTAAITGLTPVTKYYFQLQITSGSSKAAGSIVSFTTPKISQTITFKQPVEPVIYGVKPIAISVKASSGLPVTLTLKVGHATLSGTTLTIKAPGKVTLLATQSGNAQYQAAPTAELTFTVESATLKVIAANESMTQGAKVPALKYSFSGFVNGDTQSSAVRNTPTISTTAKSTSMPGPYPIKILQGTLSAPKYTLKFVNGTMTVKP